MVLRLRDAWVHIHSLDHFLARLGTHHVIAVKAASQSYGYHSRQNGTQKGTESKKRSRFHVFVHEVYYTPLLQDLHGVSMFVSAFDCNSARQCSLSGEALRPTSGSHGMKAKRIP